MEAEDQRNKKSEQKQMSYDDDRLEGLETCEVWFVQFWDLAWITSIT